MVKKGEWMAMSTKCNGCGVNILSKDNFSKFPCPSCGKEAIIRCNTCKTLSNKYSCGKCGFTGP